MSNYNSPMNLAPKASFGLPRRRARHDAGYAMAALLVGMAVMAIMLSAAMPTWSQMIRRDKEEELIFRGTQYARAINQYQRKFANASPANLDVLIEQRLLRKKFRDPLSPGKDGEFQMLYLSNQAPASRGGAFGAVGGAAAGRGTGTGSATGPNPSGAPGEISPGATTSYSTTPSGGIVGVTSKNTGASIKVYKGKKRYNEWQFVGMEQSPQGGGPGGPAGVGGRGGREGGRGGREGGGGGTGGGFGSGGRGQGGFGGRGGSSGGFPGGRGPAPSPPR